MRLLLPALLLLFCSSLHAQFSAYDPFDDNSNEWITFTDDTAVFSVKDGKLDMTVNFPGNYINAKGAVINDTMPFRAEIHTSFVSGNDSIPYGLCWGAADLFHYHAFYITAAGKFGFRMYADGTWKDVTTPAFSPAINRNGTNWLRVSTIAGVDGKLKLALCINELVVRTLDYVRPAGNYYGAYLGGISHILFDDFIVYQRGAVQEEFEPADLSLSLSCKTGQWHYASTRMNWSCCVENGCRVDVDSVMTRFWYNDQRAGDYSVLVVPFDAAGDGDFFNAARRDFVEYMRDTADPVIPVRIEEPLKRTIGTETEVVQLGETYSAPELGHNQYLRRYYVHHPFDGSSGLMFQFIVPEGSECTATLDLLVQQVISTMEFR